jgi:transcriptional regulator with XRE-family HTH domain
MGAIDSVANFGGLLKYWRGKRGHSQLQLAHASKVSQRHLSFLESGRAQPSRDIIIKLAIVLDVPLRQRNAMLLSAGFAPAYQQRSLSDPQLAIVRQALDFMLAQQMPFPAIVVDRLWQLQLANPAALHLLQWLSAGIAQSSAMAAHNQNILALLLDRRALGQFVVNWADLASEMLNTVQREALTDGPAGAASKFLDELLRIDGVHALQWRAGHDAPFLPVLPVHLQKDGCELRLFSTVTTMGVPHDVTAHELRIECFFPADEATREWFARAVKLAD